jgi:hypothetical protein
VVAYLKVLLWLSIKESHQDSGAMAKIRTGYKIKTERNDYVFCSSALKKIKTSILLGLNEAKEKTR